MLTYIIIGIVLHGVCIAHEQWFLLTKDEARMMTELRMQYPATLLAVWLLWGFAWPVTLAMHLIGSYAIMQARKDGDI